MREVDARPHPGKFNETFGHADLMRMHGAHFVKFLELRRRHDPDLKFANAFTRQMFGDGWSSPDSPDCRAPADHLPRFSHQSAIAVPLTAP